MRAVGLLRGINVGGGNRVVMAELRTTLEAAGYPDVSTILNSGNVCVETDHTSLSELRQDLEGIVAQELGVAVPVMVRSAADIAALVTRAPFQDLPPGWSGSAAIIMFMDQPVESARWETFSQQHPEVVPSLPSDLAVFAADGVANLTVSYAFVEKSFGVVATARSWNTVMKIHERLG